MAVSSIFTGSSSYSEDFQNLITRATKIASLPIDQLTADQTSLNDQSTAIDTLDTKFQALQSALDGISDSLSGAAFQADVSDKTKVNVNLSEGAMEGVYSVDVVDAGSYASSMSAGNWVAGSGATRSYRLSLGGTTYSLSPASNSAASVAAEINSKYGDLVRATIVNVGSGSQADYRISLQATALGDLQPKLLTGPLSPVSKQEQKTAGSNTLAASQTTATWNDDPALTFQLSLGGQTYALTPADTSASGVADAINSSFGDRVTATVVNAGDESTPDYRISLTAKNPGDLRPDILADDGVSGPVSVQTQNATGSDTHAVSRTATSWVTDTGATLTYQLSLGGRKYDVTPADNSAQAVVSAINSQQGDKVTAQLVDIVSNGVHDYRISLTALTAGDLRPDLIVSEKNLQTQQTTGALARYIVNNSGQVATSTARYVDIATGVTVQLLANDSGTPVNITVTRSTSALSDALSKFADAYNGIVDELDAQHQETGVLSSQSLVSTLERALSGIATYTSSGSVDNLPLLGLELDKTGHLSFSSFKLMGADFTNSSGVTAFLGSATSGFIKAATEALKSVENTTTGLLATAKGSLTTQLSDLADTIADAQERVDRMTERMQQQMSEADALIASMQQQYSYVANMFEAMRTSSEQYG